MQYTFTAAGPNGFFDQQTTVIPSTPGPGVVTFAGLAGGAYTLTQQSLDPDWIVTMYCSLADADDVVPFTRGGQGEMSLTLPADTGVVCDFYTIPPADLATTLQVVNYTCPMGTHVDDTTPLATLETTCTATLDGIDVTLAPLGQQGSTLESDRAVRARCCSRGCRRARIVCPIVSPVTSIRRGRFVESRVATSSR